MAFERIKRWWRSITARKAPGVTADPQGPAPESPDPAGPPGQVRPQHLATPADKAAGPPHATAQQAGLATLWADVSVWQRPVDDSYPHPMFAFRSNDGANYRDPNFAANRAWADRAANTGRLVGYIVYYVYRPGQNSVGTLQAMVGQPHPRMAVMVDVESWGGQIRGNQSAGINADIARLRQWLGDPRRVVGYGNVGDLNGLWPTKPADVRVVVASYGANPGYPPHKFAHQYADNVHCPPFGPCDANSADGMTAADLAAMFGFTAGPAPTPPPPAELIIQQGGLDMGSFSVNYWQGGDNAFHGWAIKPDGSLWQYIHPTDINQVIAMNEGKDAAGHPVCQVENHGIPYPGVACLEVVANTFSPGTKAWQTVAVQGGVDNHLWQKIWTPKDGWSNWIKQGGPVVAPPAGGKGDKGDKGDAATPVDVGDLNARVATIETKLNKIASDLAAAQQRRR